MAQTEPLLRAEDVARMLQTSRKSVYRWAELGTIPSIRFSRRCIRFDREAIEAYLERCAQDGWT
jgi:excisionase family DNA binding protein